MSVFAVSAVRPERRLTYCRRRSRFSNGARRKSTMSMHLLSQIETRRDEQTACEQRYVLLYWTRARQLPEGDDCRAQI